MAVSTGIRCGGLAFLRHFVHLAPVVILAPVPIFALLMAADARAGQTVSGFAEADHDIALSTPVSGRIGAIQVREGDTVAKDQPILHLDKRMEELDLAQRRLTAESTAELVAAEKKLVTLSRQLEAARRLFNSTRSISRDEIDRREVEVTVADGERRQLRVAKDIDKVEYDLARERLEQRSLTAPVAGVIAELLKDVGEGVQANEPVVRLVAFDDCIFVATLDRSLATRFSIGQGVTLHFPAGEGPASDTGGGDTGPGTDTRSDDPRTSVPGRISFVSPIVDPASGLVKVKATFDNRTARIRPGTPGIMDIGALSPTVSGWEPPTAHAGAAAALEPTDVPRGGKN